MTPLAGRAGGGGEGGLVLALDIGATKTLLAVRPFSNGVGPEGWRGGRSFAGGSGAGDSPTIRFTTERDPETLVARIAIEARRAAAGRPLVAAGCAVPGPLERATGRIVHSPNLGWHDFPLGDLLADRLGVPVAMDDDAAAGALGESRYGAGRGADPFAYVTVGSGVGVGLVLSGRPLQGAHGFAGEVGHLTVDPAGPRCGCGRRGDVEAYVGGASLARRARAAWAAGSLVGGRTAPRDADGVFRAARAGDPVARDLVAEAAEALGRAFAAIGAVLDPACIAVGGAIGLGQPVLVRRATAIARRRCISETGRSLVVVPAGLAEESVLAGAAALGTDLARRWVGRAGPEGAARSVGGAGSAGTAGSAEGGVRS